MPKLEKLMFNSFFVKIKTTCCVSVFYRYTRLLSWDGSLLFRNRKDILNTALLIRIIAYKQHIQLLGSDANE